MMNKWLILLSLLLPTTVTAQVYSACPKSGNSSITVSTSGISTNVPVVVRDYTYNGTPPWYAENYTYSSISALRANPVNSGFYGTQQSLNINPICNVVRLNFNPAEATGGVCDKYYVGYDVSFPSATQQAFVEIWIRFDSTFRATRPQSDSTATGCKYGAWWDNSGFVMLMGRVDNGSGAFGATVGMSWPYGNRFDVGVPCHFEWPITSTWTKQQDEDFRHTCGYSILASQYGWRYDPNGYTSWNSKLQRFDGKWHRYRFWFKAMNTSVNSGGVGVWIDDEHMGTLPIQDVTTNGIIGLSIGRFMWHKPVKSQWVEYGRIRVWNTNPGWVLCEKFCMQ